MSVDSIRSAVAEATRNGPVSRADVRRIFEAANDNGEVDAAERTELRTLIESSVSRFTDAARAEFQRMLSALPTPTPVITPGREPTEPEKNTYEAKFRPWTTTYW